MGFVKLKTDTVRVGRNLSASPENKTHTTVNDVIKSVNHDRRQKSVGDRSVQKHHAAVPCIYGAGETLVFMPIAKPGVGKDCSEEEYLIVLAIEHRIHLVECREVDDHHKHVFIKPVDDVRVLHKPSRQNGADRGWYGENDLLLRHQGDRHDRKHRGKQPPKSRAKHPVRYDHAHHRVANKDPAIAELFPNTGKN